MPKSSRRRWSVFEGDGEENNTAIPEDLKKYVRSALKEYREVKLVDKPDEEVKKVLKVFNKEKSVDN
jgi:hypothetical protein